MPKHLRYECKWESDVLRVLTWSRSSGSLPESVLERNFGQTLSLFLCQLWFINTTELLGPMEHITERDLWAFTMLTNRPSNKSTAYITFATVLKKSVYLSVVQQAVVWPYPVEFLHTCCRCSPEHHYWPDPGENMNDNIFGMIKMTLLSFE